LTDDCGELAAMLLGDLGADVIKIEPPEGSPSRRLPPFLDDAPEPERSLQYFAFNRNKRGITLDLNSETGRSALLALAEKADFLIESGRPGEMEELGLGFDVLRQVNSRLVFVSVSAFGQDGPLAGSAANDLTLAAMGGPMSVQGDPARPPVRVTVPQVWLHASAEAAVAALTAHARMLRTGEAQLVDVSAQAAMVWTMLNAMVAHGIQGFDFKRGGSDLQLGLITMPLVFECADGYVVVMPNSDTLVRLIPLMVDEGVVPAEWLEDENWATYDTRLIQREPVVHEFDDVVNALRNYLRLHTKQALFEYGLQEGIVIAPVTTTRDVAELTHLREREYWLTAPLPDGREVDVPGVFARLSVTPTEVRRWPPKLGAHNDEVLGGAPGRAVEEATARPKDAVRPTTRMTGKLPFEGLKVADFSWIVVGPTAAKYLADHGATVVRVESENPPDRLRVAAPFKDAQPGANRSQFFGGFNTSKYSLTLNLKNPAGVDVARRLISWADVYLESFTPGTVDDLGIGYETARSLNPSVIMASTSLMGQSGPARSVAGFGYHAGAIAGFYEVTGWPDSPPDGPWFAYTDTIAPRVLASTLMAALDHRRRTGQGQFIDACQLEMALHYLAPQIVDFNVSGKTVTRAGNHSETMAPHAAYPCSGEDQWCAVAVESDAQWEDLRRALGYPGWAQAPKYDTTAGRLQHQEELDARISDWTSGRSAEEVMSLLQSAGVPAGVVQRSSDLLRDAQLAHRRFFRYLDHPEMGNIPYSGHQFRIRGYDSGPRFPAPLLGQHNEFVMRDILGMTDEEIWTLRGAVKIEGNALGGLVDHGAGGCDAAYHGSRYPVSELSVGPTKIQPWDLRLDGQPAFPRLVGRVLEAVARAAGR
jgi:crotonobetainyl-CoA:carnitine CoA-transferase CaiB-like acyl-CoA transferase